MFTCMLLFTGGCRVLRGIFVLLAVNDPLSCGNSIPPVTRKVRNKQKKKTSRSQEQNIFLIYNVCFLVIQKSKSTKTLDPFAGNRVMTPYSRMSTIQRFISNIRCGKIGKMTSVVSTGSPNRIIVVFIRYTV